MLFTSITESVNEEGRKEVDLPLKHARSYFGLLYSDSDAIPDLAVLKFVKTSTNALWIRNC